MKYILIADAYRDTNEYMLERLASQHYPDWNTVDKAVTETLKHGHWVLLELSAFCRRWNDSTCYEPEFDPNSSYAVILEIGEP